MVIRRRVTISMSEIIANLYLVSQILGAVKGKAFRAVVFIASCSNSYIYKNNSPQVMVTFL